MPDFKTALWAEVDPPPARSALQGDIQVDVAIVGAGITGITAAHLLVRAGLRVAVVESRRVGSGETKRSTAHLTEVLDLRFRRLRSRFGIEGAKLAVEGHRAAIERIAANTHELGIECELTRVEGYLVAEAKEEVQELEAEAVAARALNLTPTLVGGTPLPVRVAGALCFRGQAQVNPRLYLDGLAAKVEEGGGQIFETTHVHQIEDGEPCRVVTDHGTITARDVIVASGVPVSNVVALHTKLAAYRTYAIAVRQEAPSAAGLVWDMKDPYHYVRGHVLQGTPYLIVGGEDHKVGESDDTTRPFSRLEAYVAERLGQTVAPTDLRWAGQIIEPADGLPYVGRNSWSRHIFVATGYAGNGITGGTWAGSVLADQVQGISNAWTALLDPTRIKPLASVGALVSENASYPKHLVTDRLLPLSRRSALDRIAPGEGAVVSVRGTKLAAYRNGEGQLSAVSPVCTHMGCFVHWNTAEKSWDCPCHGSRFDAHGRVLNGPATSPLDPKTIPLADGRLSHDDDVPARDSWTRRAGRAAGCGALATAVMSLFMEAARRADLLGTPPPKKVTDRLLGATRLSTRSHHRWIMTAVNHLAFGAAAAIPFALLSRRLDKRVARLVAGAGYGVGVWAIMYQAVLPAVGLMREPRADRPGRPMTMALAHLIYGGALGLLTGGGGAAGSTERRRNG
jgi:glycine/D-amino acid oxidase-like deaminating enzyme/nitrite reductase/ring-hydroxylating ferredoxin subunit